MIAAAPPRRADLRRQGSTTAIDGHNNHTTTDGLRMRQLNNDGTNANPDPAPPNRPNTTQLKAQMTWAVLLDLLYHMAAGIVLGLNVALWAALAWLVPRIDTARTAPILYYGVMAAIIAIVVVAASAIEWFAVHAYIQSNYPSLLISQDAPQPGDANTEEPAVEPTLSTGVALARGGIIVAGLCAVVLPFLYFFRTALPTYHNAPKWKYETSYEQSLAPPGFALFGHYNDGASAIFDSDTWTKCYSPQWNDTCNNFFPNSSTTLNSTAYGNPSYYAFNTSLANTPTPANAAPKKEYTSAGDKLLLQVGRVNWNFTEFNSTYGKDAMQKPVLYAAVYDPTLSGDNLTLALDCGVLSWTEIPAFDSTTITILSKVTKDPRNMIAYNTTTPECEGLASYLHTIEYKTYEFYTSSSGSSDISQCEVSRPGGTSYGCFKQVLIRYGSFVVSTMRSEPGILPLDILPNISAILGAVAWVQWFTSIFT
ncbi:hypothetical protein LTR17_008976 [Elasticomyces elasticus]|nr:hypothetical protein LTR17_008976 [Elasticomyces elasticus]